MIFNKQAAETFGFVRKLDGQRSLTTGVEQYQDEETDEIKTQEVAHITFSGRVSPGELAELAAIAEMHGYTFGVESLVIV